MKHTKPNRSKHYRQGKAPSVKNVRKFLRDVHKRAKKKGVKFYKKRRELAARRIEQIAKLNNISGTITSSFWKLKGLCILIGVEQY